MEDSLVCAASTRYPSKVLQFLISVQGHHKACAPPSATRSSNYKLLDILHNCEYSMVSWSIGVQEVSVYHARVILRSWASADEALHLSQGLRWRVRLYVVKAPPGGKRITRGGGGIVVMGANGAVDHPKVRHGGEHC